MILAVHTWQGFLRWLRGRPASAASRRRRCVPRLEPLEARLTPAAHDTLATAIPLALMASPPAQASGILAGPNQADLYSVALAAGAEITADVQAGSAGSPASCLRVFDAAGRQLAFQENTGRLDTALTFDALTAGTFYVGVSSNGNYTYDPNATATGRGGLSAGSYTLTATLGSILVTQAASNFTLGTAQPIIAPAVVQGAFAGGQTAYYRFTTAATGGLSASVTPADGTAFPARLALYGSAGQLLIQSDGMAGAGSVAQLSQHLATGTYYLAVSPVPGLVSATGNSAYLLDATLTPAQPPLQPQPVGAEPTAVVTADLNHDGNLDLVTADNGDGTIGVLLGNGDGSFRTAVTYFAGNGVTAVAVGDLYGDGNLDLVTANQFDNSVSVLRGNGDGTFQAAVTYPLGMGNGPTFVAVADLNHDGHLDIITTNSGTDLGTGTVSVLLNNGNGTFQAPVFYAVGADPHSVVVGDFRGDGHLDLAVANYEPTQKTAGIVLEGSGVSLHVNYGDSTVSVLAGRGDGTFDPAVTYPVGAGAWTVAAADLTGAGHLDLVTANSLDNSVSVLRNRGDGTFLPAVSYAVAGNPQGLAVADFDHDGHPDIVTADQGGGTVSVLRGAGNGTFAPPVPYLVGGSPQAVAVGDFRHDGTLDLATALLDAGAVAVLPGRGDGTFLPAGANAAGQTPLAVAVGDFNGNTGVVTADYLAGVVSVLLGRGDGTFAPAVAYPVKDNPTAVAVGDLNNDGAPDIVTANFSTTRSSVSVLLGRGDGTFLPAVSYPVGLPGTGSEAVCLADLTGDGTLDIVTADAADNTVSVLLGVGDGTFRPAVIYTVGGGSGTLGGNPVAVAVGNFNGHPDIVTANSPGDTVSVLLGHGDGTFQAATTYRVGISPHSVAVANFGRGGNADIVTASGLLDTVSVLAGNGDGTFRAAKTYRVGSRPQAIAVGDFGHDGLMDIATANFDNTVSILPGQADGTFGPAVQYAVAGNPQALAVGDVNNDRNLDLVTANADDTITVLLGQKNGQFQTTTPGSGIAINYTPTLADLNGDSLPDALILNSQGNLLFRSGLPAGSANRFAPPVTISTGVRDVVVFRSAAGPAIAAVDAASNHVTVYAWSSSRLSFQVVGGFDTGNLPVRIAAGDLTGSGFDDLVVANDFDQTVTIAFPQADGTFTTLTRPVGVGPSGITIANLGGPDGPDIVVSGQVSGDVTVLRNDPARDFTEQGRYRAGAGLFDLLTGAGSQGIQGRLQTVGVVAGTFTGSGRTDLVAVNAGARSFTLLANQGAGSFPEPPPTAYPTSAAPGPAVSLVLPGDTLPSVAILMEDVGQVWIYRNRGDGTFAPPEKIDAGNAPAGLAVAHVDGRLALLVGNSFGDILILLDDGHGGLAPDRADLHNVPLAVGTVAGTGQPYAVVADQQRDTAAVYDQLPGTNQFGSPVALNSGALPFMAPGAVQLFPVPGNPNPYLVVANSLNNNVLVYPGLADGHFGTPTAYAVGFNPVAVTVADLTGDGVPDLVVANQGSNDVSVLIGAVDPMGGWTATPYQRLPSGGQGPVAVAVVNAGSPHGPDLQVTNSDGTVVTLPGIGSGGHGSGFFQDLNPPTISAGVPLSRALVNPTTGQFVVLGEDGSLHVQEGAGFVTLIGAGVTAVADFGTLLAVGLENGSVSLLAADGTVLASQPTGFTDQPSALAILQNGSDLDVYATLQGRDAPIIVSFAFIPIVTQVSPAPAVALGTNLPGADLVLVATLLSGGLAEPVVEPVAEVVPPVEVFAVFLPPAPAPAEVVGDAVVEVAAPGPGRPAELAGWESFPLGVAEALGQRLQRQQAAQRFEEILDMFEAIWDRVRGSFPTPAARPAAAKAAPQPEAAPRVAGLWGDRAEALAPGPAGDARPCAPVKELADREALPAEPCRPVDSAEGPRAVDPALAIALGLAGWGWCAARQVPAERRSGPKPLGTLRGAGR